MVYLRKIETRGFKSMGSKLVTAPVERGFVAITGPNGSGKSNLLDAILFALGENSAKTLRVPTLSGLIYDGAVEEQKPSSAKVSLQFDNTDRKIPLDSDNVTISRELRQNGESIYFLNGKHTQRSNLSDLLENALIASRGLNVVLQGMITRIAELVPDEKRKLIEQMVGIAQFDEKKNLALQQLREADVKLEVAMAKIGEIRERVQLLELQRNDMLRLKQLESEINWLTGASISTKLALVRKTLSQRREASYEFSRKLQDLQNRLTSLLKSIEELETQRDALIKSAVNTGTAQIEAEIGRATNELNALKREREEAATHIDKMRQVAPVLAQMKSESLNKIAQTEEQIASVRGRLALAEDKKREILEEQHKLKEKRGGFETEFTNAQEEIGLVKKERDKALSIEEETESQYNTLISTKQNLVEKFASIGERIKFYEDTALETEKTANEISAILQSQKEELKLVESSKAHLEDLRKKVEKQLDIAALILEKTERAVTQFDSDLSAMETVAADEIALSMLESLGKISAIPGYYGPLRNLVKFDQDYSQAIAAIGKEWMNAVVVDDIDSLIRTTETARKLKISRLATIPLSEVSEFETSRALKNPDGMIARVTDIVHTDRKFRRVVNFIFGDAVIVDSPKNAFLAARNGFRAVTLQGDVFEPKLLAFEIGYSKGYAKITSLLSKQESFENIRKILESFREIIEKRKNTLSNLEAKSSSYLTEEQAKNIGISKIEAKLEDSRQILERYGEYSRQLKEKQVQIRDEISRMNTSIEDKLKLLNEQTFKSQEIARKLESMDLTAFNEKLSLLNKEELGVSTLVEANASEIRELMNELTRAQGELVNGLKPALDRAIEQEKDVQNDIETKEKFLIDTQPKLQELEIAFSKVKEEEEKILARSSQIQPMLEAVEQKLKAFRSEEQVVRRSISSADRELVTANLDVSRMQESESRLLGELAMCGYPEPIEEFDGAEELLRELRAEYEPLRNNVNLIADKNYRENFENYKYSSVRKNELEKERNAIVTFIETIDS